MPTVYTHWHFGDECIETMPDNLKEVIEANRDIYDLGVHGPDFLFYDFSNKKARRYGSQMHKVPAREFFEKAAEAYRQHEEKEEMLSYLMGFLSHFALDSTCHSYVERKKEVSTVSHNRIESEYDKYLIRKDCRKLNLVDRTEHMKPTRKLSKIIAYFFPYGKNEIYRSLKWQEKIVDMENCVSERKYYFFRDLLIKINHANYADLMMDQNDFRPCNDSNIRLDKLKDKALKLYPDLMLNYLNYINGDDKLSKYFDHVFDAWPDYKKIPILSYEEELKYIVK